MVHRTRGVPRCRRRAKAQLSALVLVFCGGLLAAPAPADARGLGLRRATKRLSTRVLKTASRWARNVGIALAPVRVRKLKDGSMQKVRWGFSRRGKAIPKQITTQMPDGRQFTRTLSYAKVGKSFKLQSTTIETIAGKLARPTVRRFSLADNKTHVSRGEIAKVKRMTRARALKDAVLGSPAVHVAGTTGFFFGFWHVAPGLIGWQLTAGQTTAAALGTKGLTLPVVAWKTVRELRLHKEK
jgi:hypothetical protein